MTRREFSRATRRAAWERSGGRCEMMQPLINSPISHIRCGAMFSNFRFHYDHVDPDWFSKNNELENCQVICEACHRDKTARDVHYIAKAKRLQDKRIKALTSKRPMPGSRASGFRKRMDGTVVRR